MLGDHDCRRGMRPARHQAELPCHVRLASSSSDLADSPLGSTHFVSLWARCHAMPNNLSRRATARAVMKSNLPLSRSTLHSATVTSRKPNSAMVRRRKSARSRRGSFKRHRPAAEDGDDHPGRPGPEPMSHQLPPPRQPKHLSAVKDMSGPNFRYGARRDQVLAGDFLRAAARRIAEAFEMFHVEHRAAASAISSIMPLGAPGQNGEPKGPRE